MRSSSGSESWIGGLFWRKSSSPGPKSSSQNQAQNLNQVPADVFKYAYLSSVDQITFSIGLPANSSALQITWYGIKASVA